VAGVYVLADRSNAAIHVIDTSTNTLINTFTPGFAGATGNNDTSGPDGVFIVNHTELWVGDGKSTVWVLQLHNGHVKAKISTALKGPGTDNTRADELCYDPRKHIIMIANDASSPSPFVTFISSTSHAILGRIVMDGTKGAPTATNGIEQCQWSPRTGKFYINLPQTGTTTDPGLVLVIDPVSETIERTWSVPVAGSTACIANQGMAIGPKPQILLGCNGPTTNSLIISEDLSNASGNPVSVIKTLTGMGGNDQVWFNPGDDQYFLANSTQGLLGVADPDGTQDTNATGAFPATSVGSHSVAADPVRNQVYVPLLAAGCTTAGSSSNFCIGVYTVTSGTDDPSICVGQGSPVISVADEGTGDPVVLKAVCPPRGHH
jgi:hypothetical protein